MTKSQKVLATAQNSVEEAQKGREAAASREERNVVAASRVNPKEAAGSTEAQTYSKEEVYSEVEWAPAPPYLVVAYQKLQSDDCRVANRRK